MQFDGEIQYERDGGLIHSDMVGWHREVLHMALDEYLDNATGKPGEGFYIGDCTYMPESFDDMRDLLAAFRERKNK